MPLTYVIDKERRLVISTGTGVLTYSEGLAHAERLKNDPEFDPAFYQLADVTQVTELRLTADEVRHWGSIVVFAGTAKRAFVIRNGAVHGMARVMAAFRSLSGGKEEIVIFRDRDSALKWLLGP